MKKILLLFAVFIMTTNNLIAQNANRSGVFLELQGGAALGDVIVPTDNDCTPVDQRNPAYLQGGMTGSIDAGYRWSTSSFFAIEAKVGMWTNFADLKNTYNIRLMPGIRWTSRDLSNTLSMYAGWNVGIGLFPSNDSRSTGLLIPIELSAGLNLGKNLYLGIVVNYLVNHITFDTRTRIYRIDGNDIVLYRPDNSYTYNSNYRHFCFNILNYFSLGLKIGYKF